MDLTANFKSYQERVTSALVNVTRSASQVSNQDLSFHRSSSEKLSRSLDSQNTHLLRLTSKLLKAATQDTNLEPPKLRDQDDVEDNWRRIVDVVDDLLEKADVSLDEFTGAVKRLSPALQDEAQTPPKPPKSAKGLHTLSAVVTQKPQQYFDKQVNNYEAKPFKPLLKSKPHATVPLDESIGAGEAGYKHPYALEIEQSSFPPSTYQMAPAVPFTSPDDSAVIFVDTEEGVQRMLEELKNAKEIAIDLEHNDRRSYVGLVCLMQISTREKDWIVDTLKPWRENLQILNDVFADPNILKVFHGSSMDMIWLQRDLGLYVVGLFDTYHACCALQFPGKSLKYLLQRFANFQAQKQYQTADWRVRPLPAELIDYARSDTHYLLYIYDQLRNMLLEASTPGDNLIDRVLRGSKGEALQVYERPIYDRDRGLGAFGWFDLLMQRSVKFDNEQFGVFRAVHEWRDKKARDWDEGLQYVMSNSALWSIAENMPTYSGGLHNCVRPMPKPVADNAKELIEVIKQGKIDGRNGPSVHEVMLQNEEIYSAGRRYRRIQKKESDSTYQGVGAILQQLTESGEVQLGQNLATTALNVSNGEPVATRSVSSHFWGAVMPLQESPFPSDDTAALDALGSVLPLPTLSAASFCEAGTLPSPPPTRVKASEPAPANPVPGVTSSVQGDGDDVFILKELSHIKKRKAEDEDDDVPVGWPPTNGMDHPNTTESGDAALDPTIAARKLAKQQKKAEKRAKKEAAKVEAAAIAAQPVVPFDYASAESLLHSIGDQSVNEDGGQGVKRMNPFAKALDTSTGARRPKMGQELAGKTATFKS